MSGALNYQHAIAYDSLSLNNSPSKRYTPALGSCFQVRHVHVAAGRRPVRCPTNGNHAMPRNMVTVV